MDIAKNSVKKRLSFVVMSVLVLSMCFSQIMPMTTEAAKKKLAVKSVELKINGEKVNGKTITVRQNSKVKVQVIVNPSKAKKSVKWAKLSKKSKKIAYIKGSAIKAGKKNGTVKMTVTVKGKNGKSKKAWLKVKVVKTLPKPSTPSTPSKPVSPASPSNPSTPSKPSNPGTTGKIYTVRFNKSKGYEKMSCMEGTTLNLTGGAYADTTHSDSSYKFVGWSLVSNGTIKDVKSSVKVTGNTELYAVWVKKDLSEWNPTFVQGDGSTLDTNLPVYGNDGIKTYSEVVSSYMKEGWIACDCGAKCQFRVKDHKGNVLVIDKFLYTDKGFYALTNIVSSTKTVSSDWAFLDITSAVEAVHKTKCGCNVIYNLRSLNYDGSTSATLKR